MEGNEISLAESSKIEEPSPSFERQNTTKIFDKELIVDAIFNSLKSVERSN